MYNFNCNNIMKSIVKVLLGSSLLLLNYSCEKDSESFVNDYNAPLTEAKGVKHEGNYFPLKDSFYWQWDGSERLKGKMSMTYNGQTQEEPMDETVQGYISYYVYAPEQISLTSGKYTVFPVEETSVVEGADSRSTNYYENAEDAIYLRAIKLEDGNMVEVKNSLFLKKPLVVGDKWESRPTMNLEEYFKDSGFEVDESKVDISGATYVIGKETLEGTPTVRLDQRVEAKISMNYDEQGVKGTMTFDIKGTFNTNLLENTGVFRQKSNLTMTMSANISGNGEKMTMTMNLTSEGEYNLITNSPEMKYQIEKKGLKNASMDEPENDLVKKQIKIGLRLAEVIQKIAL